MNIYLIRHADAEKASLKIRDFDRELSQAGKKSIETSATYWKTLIPTFNYIVSSPLLRAKHTAEIIAKQFEINDKILIDQRLSPGSETEFLIDIANELEVEELAFVGHQPDLSEHLANFISEFNINIVFKKGSIAKVNLPGKIKKYSGILEFLIPPDIFKEKTG